MEKVRNDNSYSPLIDRLYELYNDHCEGDIPSEKYSLYKLYFETGDRNTYEKTYFSKRIRMNTLAILCLIYPERNEYIEKLQDCLEGTLEHQALMEGISALMETRKG